MVSDLSLRLPPGIRPQKYSITLAPDLDAFTFAGDESIDLTIDEPTTLIELNAADIEIQSARMALADGSLINASVTLDEEGERASIRLEAEAPAGTARLDLSFTGVLNDQLRGFYRSQYMAVDGSTQYLATTQFEATDARRAFPCWDEPSIKASFEVTLVVPHQMSVVSNMPQATERFISEELKSVKFQPTPLMSTYLLAFVVGDLASVQGSTKSGTRVGVWATRGKEEQGRFALENSLRILDYMNDYFGIPYPLPKMDHIAIPDFAAGAMENWGAITYRETALLFDPQNSAAQARQRILEVVAHEMAHMWFGDLVTMEWWDDLWLNESFASWMGDKAVDHLYPEWQMWTQFVSNDTNNALGLDGLRNSHPIEARVNDPSEIRELFDAISYSKGGSVLRMLEDFLGPEVFQKGLHGYLSGHAYGNARTEHLWDALAGASSKPVTAIMDSWVKQMGYPVVDADFKREGDSTVVSLSQKRFLYDDLLGGPSDSTVWKVPVGIIQAGIDGKESLLMQSSSASTTLPPAPVEAWVKVNAGQTGFFRVAYPREEWEKLRHAVVSRDLSATDRLGLQNDAYALMKAGHLPATVFLSMAQAYIDEMEAPVWSDLASNLRGLEALLLDAPYVNSYRQFARGIFTKAAATFGWDAGENEGHLDAIRRSTVLGQMGAYGDDDVLAEAVRRFDAYRAAPESLHPDLRGVVLGLTAQQGDRTTYDTLWKMEKAAVLSEEKVRLLGAMTRFQNPEILQDLLKRALSDEVRSQDTMIVLVQTSMNQIGRDLAWDFMKENWNELDRRYGKGGFAIMRIVSIAGGFTTMARHDEVADFFERNPAPSAARTIQQSLERIRLNVKWLERNETSVGEWLSDDS